MPSVCAFGGDYGNAGRKAAHDVSKLMVVQKCTSLPSYLIVARDTGSEKERFFSLSSAFRTWCLDLIGGIVESLKWYIGEERQVGTSQQSLHDTRTSVRSRWMWGAVAIALFAISIWAWLSLNVEKPKTPASPYGIPVGAVTSYFAEAASHQDYQVTALALHQWIARGQPVTLIDVRQPSGTEGFNLGHIPGAYNIPLQDFGTELMATHSYTKIVPVDGGSAPIHFFPLPRHTPIVVMCYDGDGGEMTPAILRLLGYDAYGLKDGVSSWNPLLNVWPSLATVTNLPLTTRNSPQSSLNPPRLGHYVLGFSWASKVASYWHNLNRAYPTGYSRPWTIAPAALFAALSGPTPPQVIDLRPSQQFNAGHIAGSINIPFGQLGANLNLVSPTKEVVLVSQTLQNAAQADALLRLLGYHAYVLQRGIVTWSSTLGTIPTPHQYPIVTGP